MPRKPQPRKTPEEKKAAVKTRSAKVDPYLNMYKQVSQQSSQYNSRYYEKLKEEGRLHRFLEIITQCSLQNKTKESTLDEINDAFYDYFQDGGICLDTFNKMIKRYPDVGNAWSAQMGTANANASMIKDNLMNMFSVGKLTYDQQFELMKYLDQGLLRGQNSPDYNPVKQSVSSSKVESIQTLIGKENGTVDTEETTDTLNSLINMLTELRDKTKGE